uniref:Uncharacterized protein n=1 Tax=Erythrolobus australicus TaxID=1077150 RepID=A0A7S1TKP6_9RHOD|mmetsp:Transcript_2902/g.7977  ORF Transcript_2902/g.7977 Transcript_2902/m.7977 type:complete len:198 (+) Transcript_2902:217-810(+)
MSRGILVGYREDRADSRSTCRERRNGVESSNDVGASPSEDDDATFASAEHNLIFGTRKRRRFDTFRDRTDSDVPTFAPYAARGEELLHDMLTRYDDKLRRESALFERLHVLDATDEVEASSTAVAPLMLSASRAADLKTELAPMLAQLRARTDAALVELFNVVSSSIVQEKHRNAGEDEPVRSGRCTSQKDRAAAQE